MMLRRSLHIAGLLATLVVIFFGGSTVAIGQSEWVVRSFGTVAQGLYPMGNLVADSSGNLYGTTEEGGAFRDWGTVYELVRPVPPKTSWTESVLYSFTGGADGSAPLAGLIFDKAANLYGTTNKGGEMGAGTVFELTPPVTPGGAWTESVLHSFDPAGGDGGSPETELTWDRSGNLIGVTELGGVNGKGSCTGSCGTVFLLSPPATQGGTWTETIIQDFKYGQGAFPRGTPVVAANGIVYGTTYGGGLNGEGVIYRLTPPKTQGGAWTYRVIHTFTAGLDGASPRGALALHGRGVLYGTATRGGASASGNVFALTPPEVAGGAWPETVLYSFGSESGDGGDPAAGVIFDSTGNIYGTTPAGGLCSATCGTVFELSPPATDGADWSERILHSFPPSGGKDGSQPSGGLLLAKNGVLFGATDAGGVGGGGAVYGVTK